MSVYHHGTSEKTVKACQSRQGKRNELLAETGLFVTFTGLMLKTVMRSYGGGSGATSVCLVA